MISAVDNDKVVVPNGFINSNGVFQSLDKIDTWYPFGYMIPIDWDYLQIAHAIETGSTKNVGISVITSLCLIVNADGYCYITKLDEHEFKTMAYPSGRGIQKIFGGYGDVPTIVEAIAAMDNLSMKNAITRYVANTTRNNDVFKFKEKKISGIVAELKKRGFTDKIPTELLGETK